MKQVININFQGRVIPIEQTAYDTLKEYLNSLSNFFAAEEGKEEIVNDIENRIGELFQEKLSKGSSCITDEDVDAVIRSIGRPEDFDEQNANDSTSNQKSSAKSSSARPFTTHGKKLFRNENEKVLGGVCSGLADYFGMEITIMRIIFVVLFFFFGIGLLPYIILWAVVPSTSTTQIGSVRKRLYRDVENKYIAGVCSGLANYFGVQSWIPRLLFLLPLLTFIGQWHSWGSIDLPDIFRISFSPGVVLAYIIFWLVIPEAKSTSEKLEMKGEKVDMNSIKNSVVEELKGVQSRASKLGEEAREFVAGASTSASTNISAIGKRQEPFIGRLVLIFVKIIGYTIAILFLIALLAALVGIGTMSLGFFPLKDFVLSGGWDNVWAWGTLIFFIAVPIIGLITWIIRRLTKSRGGSNYMALSFSGLWFLGWVCLVMLAVSISKNFKRESNINIEKVSIYNQKINKLVITGSRPDIEYRRNRFFDIKPFSDLDEDTAFLGNIAINICKSPNDSFKVTIVKTASGSTKDIANKNAANINYKIEQLDSLLQIERGIAINKVNKFRNQHVSINVYVPVGKQIRVNENSFREHRVSMKGLFSVNEDWYLSNNDAITGWDYDVDYIMKEDGLYTLDGFRANDEESNIKLEGVNIDENGIDIKTEDGEHIEINENGIKIDKSKRENFADSAVQKLKFEESKKIDSLKRSIEKTEEELKKLNKKTEVAMLSGSNILPWFSIDAMM